MTLRLGSGTGSVMNHLASGTRGAPTPEVGMGATGLGWTDRHAYTIVAVGPDAAWIDARRDVATRTDNRGMSDAQAYTYAPDPTAIPGRFTLRKNGAYVAKGDGMKNGYRLAIGYRAEYYDFSF